MTLFNHILRDLRRRGLMLFLVLVSVLSGLWLLKWADSHLSCYLNQHKWIAVALLTFFVWLAILACNTLTNIFSLRKKEIGITFCQIFILLAIGIWIIGFMIVFDTKNHPQLAVGIGVVGTVLGWIFQDTLKGVMAFIHLRLNHLINIDDWIQIPKYSIDGQVIRVTLTTVTVYNWDTTTSSIPTSVLHSDHFINLQKMSDGKTYGRRMCKSFLIDTSSIHILSSDEAELLRKSEEICRYLPREEMKEGMINAQLFRLYLLHWLMNHPHVSQQPNLLVYWMEQKECGMPLQVYAFITDSGFAAFEWQQSQIIEHIVESLGWFGLRLYQRPSACDVRNAGLTELTTTIIKEPIR